MSQSATKARRHTSRTRPTVHGDDLYTWVQEQVALLRAGQLDAIDAGEIAEELSDVGSEQYDKLESAFAGLLLHMLKWDFQAARPSASWEMSIAKQRLIIDKQLRRNPGLKSRLDEAVEDGYSVAQLDAAQETALPVSTFPPACPYDLSTILTRPFDRSKSRT